MPTHPNFAPVSGSPSTLVRVASGYLIFNGAFYLLLLIISAVAFALGWGRLGEQEFYLVAYLVALASGVGLIWTGILIGRRRRIGGILALGFMALQIASALLAPRVDKFSLIFSAVGVLVVISIWNELR
jgi:hypothetical protein